MQHAAQSLWHCYGVPPPSDTGVAYSVYASDVSKQGFTLNVRCWGSTVIVGATIQWLAVVSIQSKGRSGHDGRAGARDLFHTYAQSLAMLRCVCSHMYKLLCDCLRRYIAEQPAQCDGHSTFATLA